MPSNAVERPCLVDMLRRYGVTEEERDAFEGALVPLLCRLGCGMLAVFLRHVASGVEQGGQDVN